MKKVLAPTPCAITHFDALGNVVSEETVVRDVIKARNDYQADSVVNTLRVMAEQETGEEIFVGYANRKTVDQVEQDAREGHPEWRTIWSERI